MTYRTWGAFPDSIWAPLAGGWLIGLAALLLMGVNGRIAGSSEILARLLPPIAKDGEALGRALFLLGLIAGPLLLVRFGGIAIDVSAPTAARPLLILAGLLAGFGAVLGSGGLGGHGICGLAGRSPRSLLATLAFMATAMGVVFVLRHVVGG